MEMSNHGNPLKYFVTFEPSSLLLKALFSIEAVFKYLSFEGLVYQVLLSVEAIVLWC